MLEDLKALDNLEQVTHVPSSSQSVVKTLSKNPKLKEMAKSQGSSETIFIREISEFEVGDSRVTSIGKKNSFK